MNLGILLVGVGGGAAIAALLRAGQRRAAARISDIDARGAEGSGRITMARSTGRYAELRVVEVAAWDGSTFRQTLPSAQAQQLGLVEGADVRVRVVPGEPGLGRLLLPPEPPSRFNTPLFAGLFIAALGVLAALFT